MNTVPLCVDLDGTLVGTDLMFESLLARLKRAPLTLFLLLPWLLRGRAYLKARLAEHADLNFQVLPYHQSVLAFVREEARAGQRPVYLVTAASSRLAAGVREFCGCFDDVMCSTETVNLKGRKKAAALVERFGFKQFDYIGDSRADIPVFASSRRAYLVTNAGGRGQKLVRALGLQTIVIGRQPRVRTILRAMRTHQWAKNALIFVPLILSHQYHSVDLWLQEVWAFITFSLCASGVYIVNDLVDLEVDRQHPTKRRRPFAAGAIPISGGIGLAATLFAVALGLSFWQTRPTFLCALSFYLAYTFLYSFVLKERLIIDTISLALLYTVRILAGHAATELAISHWLLEFALFFFLSLALVKRASELHNLRQRDQTKSSGRAYHVDDFSTIQVMGVASGFISILIFALYLDSSNAKHLYETPILLTLMIPILLYWMGRIWTLASRGLVNEDPVIWALRDRESYLVLGLIGAVFISSQMNWLSLAARFAH